MLRRTAEWNRLLKGLAIVFSLISYSVAPAVGEETIDLFGDAARKGPDPRKELRAEAALPGVDPADARRIGKPDMTLLADPASPAVGNTVAVPGNEQVLIGSLKTELDATRAELAKAKEIVGEVIKEYKQISESRELPPLKDAEIKFFTLQNLDAEQAALTVGSLLGHEPVRIATDERTNAVIVVGKAESLAMIEALLLRLDEQAQVAPKEKNAVAATSADAERRTLMLRVFWLANGVDGLDSADGFGYLPEPVLDSLAKLGLGDPRVVTQTVNSLSVEEGGAPAEFSTNVPAILFEQPVTLTSAGTMGATTDGRADVDMHLTVGGAGVNCELKGSLATPLGHFMVLGTANSVIPEHQASDPAAAEMGMPMGRGGEMGMAGRGDGMGRGMMMGGMPAANYNASRFAFVVQVIEAESFEPEGNGK